MTRKRIEQYDEFSVMGTDTFPGQFMIKYPRLGRLVRDFGKICGRVPQWEDFTTENIIAWKESLSVADSSKKLYMAALRSVLNDNTSKLQSCDFRKLLRGKSTVTQYVYLTEEEIIRLDKLRTNVGIEESVKRNFIIQCLEGMRSSDAMRIGVDNIGDDGMIRYVPDKTENLVVTVPVHKIADKYLRMPPKAIDLNEYNSIIRSLCLRAGITDCVQVYRCGINKKGKKYEFVSSHTGRRSFATNLYLRGVPAEDIMNLMGHTSPKVTMHYICARRDVTEKAKEFFNGK